MMYLRIVRGVTEHFRARATEWGLSVMLVAWGAIVFAPGDTFTTPAWSVMHLFMAERTWGILAMTLGATRIIALVLNGTFWTTWYGRWSPHVRALMAGLSCFIWMQISLGIFLAGAMTTALAIYPVILIFEYLNIQTASRDAAIMDGMRRNGDT